jgi:hypothetical protein
VAFTATVDAQNNPSRSVATYEFLLCPENGVAIAAYFGRVSFGMADSPHQVAIDGMGYNCRGVNDPSH